MRALRAVCVRCRCAGRSAVCVLLILAFAGVLAVCATCSATKRLSVGLGVIDPARADEVDRRVRRLERHRARQAQDNGEEEHDEDDDDSDEYEDEEQTTDTQAAAASASSSEPQSSSSSSAAESKTSASGSGTKRSTPTATARGLPPTSPGGTAMARSLSEAGTKGVAAAAVVASSGAAAAAVAGPRARTAGGGIKQPRRDRAARRRDGVQSSGDGLRITASPSGRGTSMSSSGAATAVPRWVLVEQRLEAIERRAREFECYLQVADDTEFERLMREARSKYERDQRIAQMRGPLSPTMAGAASSSSSSISPNRGGLRSPQLSIQSASNNTAAVATTSSNSPSRSPQQSPVDGGGGGGRAPFSRQFTASVGAGVSTLQNAVPSVNASSSSSTSGTSTGVGLNDIPEGGSGGGRRSVTAAADGDENKYTAEPAAASIMSPPFLGRAGSTVGSASSANARSQSQQEFIDRKLLQERVHTQNLTIVTNLLLFLVLFLLFFLLHSLCCCCW